MHSAIDTLHSTYTKKNRLAPEPNPTHKNWPFVQFEALEPCVFIALKLANLKLERERVSSIRRKVKNELNFLISPKTNFN